MSNVQRIETGVLYILVGVDIRTNALSVSVWLGLLAVTILLMAIMTVYLLSVRPSSVKVTRYGRVVKPVHKEKNKNNLLLIVAVFLGDLCYILVATMCF